MKEEFQIGRFTLSKGTYVVILLRGVLGIGRIGRIEDVNHGTIRIIVCQDIRAGHEIEDKLGFKYSWSSYKYSHKVKLTDELVIFKTLTAEEYISDKNLNFDVVEATSQSIYYKSIDLIKNKETGKWTDKKLIKKTTICSYKGHPDCCGAILLYGFCTSNELNYSRYTDFTPKDLEAIENMLRERFNEALLIHLSHKQNSAHAFVKGIGAVEKISYTNKNSGNTISVFHFE